MLVLETGGWPKDGMDVPAFAPTFLGDPDVNYLIPTLPQTNAGQRNDNGVSVYLYLILHIPRHNVIIMHC